MSTEARIAVPTLVRVSRTNSPMATRIEARIVITWCAVIVDSPMLNVLPAKNGRIVRDSGG